MKKIYVTAVAIAFVGLVPSLQAGDKNSGNRMLKVVNDTKDTVQIYIERGEKNDPNHDSIDFPVSSNTVFISGNVQLDRNTKYMAKITNPNDPSETISCDTKTGEDVSNVVLEVDKPLHKLKKLSCKFKEKSGLISKLKKKLEEALKSGLSQIIKHPWK